LVKAGGYNQIIAAEEAFVPFRLLCPKCRAEVELSDADAGPQRCRACGAALPARPAAGGFRSPRAREPAWPLVIMGVLLVAGVAAAAVLLWPRGESRKTTDDEKPEGAEGPTLLIATEEGLDLLADVLEMETAAVRERRRQQLAQASRRASEYAAEKEARARIATKADEQLRRAMARMPAGAEQIALTLIAGKLQLGPALGLQERLQAEKHPEIFGELLKLTRSGLTPLRELERQAETQYQGAAKKSQDMAQRMEEQARFLDQLGTTIFDEKEFEAAVAALTRALQVKADFGEARALRGALLCLARGEYTPAMVDCDTAIRLDQKNAGAFMIRALCNWKRGQRNQAGFDFQAATLLEPRLQRYRELFDPRD
jgi:tetratricopeptide (TPR) repeat protein